MGAVYHIYLLASMISFASEVCLKTVLKLAWKLDGIRKLIWTTTFV
jgi:hypothetical protein